jgi:hypothetical protein
VAAGGATGSGGSGGAGGGNVCRVPGQTCSQTQPWLLSHYLRRICTMLVSDRNAKREFVPVNDDEILAAVAKLPISTWSYKADESKSRHIGPMAQDFMAMCHVGSRDKTIYQIDADGVASAAIQSFSEQMIRLSRENEILRHEISNLRTEMTHDRERPHNFSRKIGTQTDRKPSTQSSAEPFRRTVPLKRIELVRVLASFEFPPENPEITAEPDDAGTILGLSSPG